MARTVVPGRFTARIDEPFVVFVIGMRVNRPLEFRKWVPTARAMGPMLRELYENPQKGFLGAEQFFYWPGAALIQYWRSFEDLERFARDPGDPHLPAWQRFNRSVKADGSVGIWHEAYLVEAGNYEVIYNNMRVSGSPGPRSTSAPWGASRPPAAGWGARATRLCRRPSMARRRRAGICSPPCGVPSGAP